jgi:hypothetical protein
MRILNKTLGLLSGIGLSLMIAGCGQDVIKKIACTTDQQCRNQTGTLFTDASDPATLAMCCSGFCVLPGGGCDTGYHYLDNDPGYGDCVPEDPMCPMQVLPDLSMPNQGDM